MTNDKSNIIITAISIKCRQITSLGDQGFDRKL